jgi:hypothetical protein
MTATPSSWRLYVKSDIGEFLCRHGQTDGWPFGACGLLRGGSRSAVRCSCGLEKRDLFRKGIEIRVSSTLSIRKRF